MPEKSKTEKTVDGIASYVLANMIVAVLVMFLFIIGVILYSIIRAVQDALAGDQELQFALACFFFFQAFVFLFWVYFRKELIYHLEH